MSTRRLEKTSGDAGAGTCSTVPAVVPVILFTFLSFPRLFSTINNAFSSHIHLIVILSCPFSAEYRFTGTDMSEQIRAHCNGIDGTLLLYWAWARKKGFISRYIATAVVFGGARPLRCNPRDFVIKYRYGSETVDRFPVWQKGGDFCCYPRVSSLCLAITGIT